jgi:hypothetical protein
LSRSRSSASSARRARSVGPTISIVHDIARSETTDQGRRDSLYGSANTKRYEGSRWGESREQSTVEMRTSAAPVSPTGVAVLGSF